MTARGHQHPPRPVWGWHTLSPNAPFADAKAYGTPRHKKIVILMTGGENTITDSSDSNASNWPGSAIWQGRVLKATAAT